MRVVLTGGGTGGHLYPGLAIADEIKKRTDCQILFVGTRDGIEAGVVPEKGYQFRTVWIGGFHRGRIGENILFPVRVIVSLVQALIMVSRFRPDVVLGTGGYVSWPVMMAGVLLRKRTVIQEQNLIPGVVTRVLSPFVNSVHLSFEGSKRFFWRLSNLRVSGNPTREDLERGSRGEGYRRFGLQPNRKTIFVFGGSQGARSINQTVLKFVDRLVKKKKVQVLWATGTNWIEEIQRETRRYGDRVQVVPYVRDMGSAYKVSDLLICRSGATTVAEVTRLGLPAVFIPFPGAAGGHQEENARVLYQAGVAEMVLEDQIREGKLEDVVFSLLDDPDRREKMGKRAMDFGKSDAASVIADDIIRLVGNVN